MTRLPRTVFLVCGLLLCVPLRSAEALFSLEDLPTAEHKKTDQKTQASQENQTLTSATQLIQRGAPQQATKLVNKFLKDHPNSAAGYEVLGAAALTQHQLSDADRAFHKALTLEPNRWSTLLLLGQMELDQDHPKQAEDWFGKALQQSPRLVAAHRGRAMALLRLGRLQEASDEAQESVKLSGGTDLEAKYVLAGIDHEMGQQAKAKQLLDEVLEVRPDHQEATLLLGIVQLDLEQYDTASELLKKAIARDPKSLWARLGLSVIERVDGHVGQSRADLEKLVAEQPTWSLAAHQLGETLLAQGDLTAALAAFAQAAKSSPQPAFPKLHAAETLLKYGFFDQATDRAKDALDAPVTASLARALLIRIQIASGHSEQAEQTLTQAIAADPKNPTWTMQLGRFLLERHRPQEALEQFKKSETLDPSLIEVIAAQAETYAALDQPTPAVQAAQRAMTVNGSGPTSAMFLGHIYEQLHQPSDAEQTYQHLLEQDASNRAAMIALASLDAQGNRTDEALQWLKRLREMEAADAPGLSIAMARTYEQLGRFDEAIEIYRQVLAKHPYQPVVLNNLAFLLAQRHQNVDEAADLADQAYRLAPGNAQFADTLGWIEHLRGHHDRAQTLLTKAAISLPDDPETHYHLGMTYVAQGMKDRAAAELQQALKNSEFPDADQARSTLKSLQ